MSVDRQRLVIFARAPRLGTVKSRLAATMGPQRALEIYRHLAAGVIAGLDNPGRWTLVVRGSPDDALEELRSWIRGEGTVEPQGDGDLGERLYRAVQDHVAAGVERLVIVGTDCPEVTANVVNEAFHALFDVDVVYGPATDGGYYLVGVRRVTPELFQEIPWGESTTLATSLERAHRAGYRVKLLHPLADVDTEADWVAWRARAGTRVTSRRSTG